MMTKFNDDSDENQTVLHNPLSLSYEEYNKRFQENEIGENFTLLHRNMHQTISTYKRAFYSRSLLVDVLTILFGIGSWIGINSTFLQLPLLVDKAPEKWSLPSYLVMVIQMANIGPLAYTILQKYSPKWIKDSYMICFVLIVGVISSLLAAFLYHKTAVVGGYQHSLSLFILVFFLALVGCTSSVLCMPYMGRFKEIYLITYLIGEGLSGFLPSIVALAQGVGGNAECIPVNTTDGLVYKSYMPPPRFSTRDFYLFVFSVMLSSCVAFILLDKLEICKKQYAAVTIVHGNNYVYENENENNKRDKKSKENVKNLKTSNYTLLMLLMAAICFFGNGIFPSIQSYSCLPYGNLAYHLTVSLSSIANPLACFLAVFLPHTSLRSILILSGCTIVIAIYAVTTAVLSPNPPLISSVWGEIFVVMSWTVLMGLVSYTKLCITAVMRSQGGKSLVWIGAISQAGSAVGSVFIFVLINYGAVFASYEPC